MMHTSQKSGGFTLIETLVAITIITIAVVGPMLTASRAVVASYIARDQLTASYLAQEGVEYVRYMRDSMYLADYKAYPSDSFLSQDSFCDFYNANSSDPSTGCDASGSDPGSVPVPPGASGASIATCLGAGDGTTKCELADPLAAMGTGGALSLAQCPGGVCHALYLNNGRYITSTAAPGTKTIFTREIKLYYPLSNEMEVVVTVSWVEHGSSYKATVTDYLSPWQ